MHKTKVLLAMSGGVDSSVAAIILQEQGFEVIGVTIRFWDDPTFADNIKDIQAAKNLAEKQEIQHYIIDKTKEFSDLVISYFNQSYLKGKTPFPCAVCNPQVKWKTIFDKANELGCEKVATGHYVNVLNENGYYYITEGIDEDKDQSFFLWGLNQEILKRAIFPLAGKNKTWVKQFASTKGHEYFSAKKESTGVCFLKDKNYREYLKRVIEKENLDIKPGNFIDNNGNTLGQHQGYPFYTVGQRRGLGFGPTINKSYFVQEIDADKNEIVLSESKPLVPNEFTVTGYHVHNKVDFTDPIDLKVRYRKQQNRAQIKFIDDKNLKVKMLDTLDSVAPGQTAVFYRDGKVLGGGFIQ